MKMMYHVGCLGVLNEIRFVTSINDGVPKFERDEPPLVFKSAEADKLAEELRSTGWLAVTVRAPQNLKYLCIN